MATTDINLLHIIHFSGLAKWSAQDAVFDNVENRFPLVPLSKILTRVKEPIDIEDETLYKRITVRLYGQGVLQRDEVHGKEIGTKRQFVAHTGQLIISRIDARNGAFGIVPATLEGAIVTNDFWLFDVHDAHPEYLLLVLSSELFQKYWQTQSSGTTNRQRVSEDDFLESTIALAPAKDQLSIVKKYKHTMNEADEADEKAVTLLRELNKTIREATEVSYISKDIKGVLSSVNFRYLSRWDPLNLTKHIAVQSKYPMITLSRVINNFMVDRDGKSLRRNTKSEENRTYFYIGMEHVEKHIGKATPIEVNGNEILSQTLMVPKGYVIYGKLRPYLNKYWENTTSEENIICSSEFFVFDTVGINREYFMAVLSSDIVQRQLPPLYSGARMPRITEDDFFDLRIPLPPESVQEEIAASFIRVRTAVEYFKKSASRARQQAKKEFEKAVFEQA